jgi:hypothetical protein
MGRLWARKFVNELFKKEKFRADFEIAKKEILEYRKNREDKKQTNSANQVECSSESTHNCSSACSNSCSSSCSNACCNSEN